MNWILIIIAVVGLTALIALVIRIAAQMNQQIASLTQQMNERLKETLVALTDAHKTVGERLDSATRIFGDVQKSLGRLEETHKQIYAIGKDIASLQDLLRAPKFRGEIGETMPGRLLEDILPKENISLQHRFKSGDIADAAIAIGSNLISIDAKFPLENFKKFSEAQTDEERQVPTKCSCATSRSAVTRFPRNTSFPTRIPLISRLCISRRRRCITI